MFYDDGSGYNHGDNVMIIRSVVMFKTGLDVYDIVYFHGEGDVCEDEYVDVCEDD
jgi:hypothetical protein